MRLISCVFLLILFNLAITSQDINNYEVLEEKLFAQKLEKLPALVSNENWEFFYKKAFKAYENEDFKGSLQFISKALLIAEKLEENFLIGKSYRFAGKIETKLNQLSKASRSFVKASDFLQQVDESAELKIEVGYLLNDWARRFSNPDFIHDNIDIRESAKLLFYALKIAENPNLQDSGLKVLTFINISNFFAIKGNYVTQIYWLEKAQSEFINSQDISNYQCEVFSGLVAAYLKLGDNGKADFYLKSWIRFQKEGSNNGLSI